MIQHNQSIKLKTANSTKLIVESQILTKIQRKLQIIITELSKDNISTSKKRLQPLYETQQEIDSSFDGITQNKLQFYESFERILFQIQVLEIILSQNKFSSVNNKNKIIINLSQNQNQKYHKNSIKFQQFQTINALKMFFMNLFDEIINEPTKKSYFKAEFQVYFNMIFNLEQQSVFLKNTTFDKQFDQLVSLIREVKKQKNDFKQKNFDLTEQIMSLNKKISSLISSSSNKKLIDCHNPQNQSINLNNINSPIKQDHQNLFNRVRKLQAALCLKDRIIQQMNRQFGEQIQKYNQVINRLKDQNFKFKQSSKQNSQHEDVKVMIKNLEKQIKDLKQSTHLVKPTTIMKRSSIHQFNSNRHQQQYVNHNDHYQVNNNNDYLMNYQQNHKTNLVQDAQNKHNLIHNGVNLRIMQLNQSPLTQRRRISKEKILQLCKSASKGKFSAIGSTQIRSHSPIQIRTNRLRSGQTNNVNKRYELVQRPRFRNANFERQLQYY